MATSIILPTPSQTLRTLITASGFRPYLASIGLDRDLDHLSREERLGSNFDLLENCQAQWLSGLRKDAGAAWSNFVEAAWKRHSTMLRSLAGNCDTTALRLTPAREAIVNELVAPEIAGALKRASLELPLIEVSTWWASPFYAWLNVVQQLTALSETELLSRLANHADLDERTLARWQQGNPLGTGLWPYRETVRSLLEGCDLPVAKQERLTGWLVIACAVQSLPHELKSKVQLAFLAMSRQALKTEAPNISNIKRAAADRDCLVIRQQIDPVLHEIHQLFANPSSNQHLIRDRLAWLRALFERSTPAVRDAHEYLWLGFSARLAANLGQTTEALKLYASACQLAWWRAGPHQHAFIHEALSYAVGVGDQVQANHYWDRCFSLGLNKPPKLALDEQTMRRISFDFERLFAPQKAKERIPPAQRFVVGPFALEAKDQKKPNALRKQADGRVRYTPFMDAVLLGDLAHVKELALAGGDPNVFIPESGENALIIALRQAGDRGRTDILNYVLTLPISRETANRPASTKRETPLHIAMNMGDAEVVEQLIKLGADVEQECFTSPSALVYAMALLHDSLHLDDGVPQQAYFDGRVPADAVDAKKGAILDCELAESRQGTLATLASPRHRMIYEAVSKLIYKSPQDYRQVVLTLLANGADPNRRYPDFNGHSDLWTPTHAAAQIGDLQVLKAMLEAGGDPWALLDETDPTIERNALWVALAYKQHNVIEYLRAQLPGQV